MQAESLHNSRQEKKPHVPEKRHHLMTDHLYAIPNEAEAAWRDYPHGAPKGLLRRLHSCSDALSPLGYGFESAVSPHECRILRPGTAGFHQGVQEDRLQ
jgi:hypothetical protein